MTHTDALKSFNLGADEVGSGEATGNRFIRLKIIPTVSLGITAFLIWIWFAALDEVALGNGKVIPPMRSQIIQSLEGGILEGIFVKEGDVVEAHQQLALLNGERFSASVGEAKEKVLALEASTSRLEAELTNREPAFSASVSANPELVGRELRLFKSRRRNLQVSAADLEMALALARKELRLTEPLVAKGAASATDVIRLQRQENELQSKLNTLWNQFSVDAHAEYNKNKSDLDQTRQILKGREDQLKRTSITSPVRGIVKNLDVTTIGGVILPGGTLMEVVPLENKLVIEARINPRDIAFIRPRLPAIVKITAYDSSIYGTIEGNVESISPDTLQDDVDKRLVYYRVNVRTGDSNLRGKDGRKYEIMPGMIASVEIKTGSKTVFEYLVKPLNKLGEALRER